MTCRRVKQLLSDSLEMRLPEDALRTLTTHVRHCPACRRLHDEFVTLGADLRELAHLAPPPDAERRAVEHWLATREVKGQGSGFRQRAFRRVVPGICLAALAVLAVGPALVGRKEGLLERGGLRSLVPRDPTGQRHHGATEAVKSHRIDSVWRVATAASRLTESGVNRPPSEAPAHSKGAAAVLRHICSLPPSDDRAQRIREEEGATRRPSGAPGDELDFLNDEAAQNASRWVTLPRDEWERLEARVRQRVRLRDDFVQVPFPRLATTSDRQVAAAVESYKREAAVVDARLAREVAVGFKGTSLSDLCERLRADTGIHLAAGPSVADEKVMVFCQKQPLREVMRQLSRPFGYTWLRSGTPPGPPKAGRERSGGYRYELVQDLKSQLLEEELRNRDRHSALLALEREIERYRPYLNLSPDEALARAKSAGAEEKELLEQLAGKGWAALQMYSRLSAAQMTALRTGQKLTFSGEPGPGELPLPPDIARGVLQSYRDWRVWEHEGGRDYVGDNVYPEGQPLLNAPEVRAKVVLLMEQSELGEFTINKSGSGFFSVGKSPTHSSMITGFALAVGVSPSVRKPDNRAANVKLAGDPGLQPRVTVQPRPSCPAVLETTAAPGPNRGRGGQGSEGPPHWVTSADVLEALHRATGVPIVADYYTRLHSPASVSVRNLSLFDALNQLSDTMRLRWHKDGSWMQFRSTSYYDDRLKEVPNRLLARWSAARRRQGMLTLDDLLEIAGLSDAQLNAEKMAQGARECYGLAEWNLARDESLRPHLRFLSSLTPAQRQAASSRAGLSFRQMTLAQQQQFIPLGVTPDGDSRLTLEALTDAALRVEHVPPGVFGWNPGEGTAHQGPPTHPSPIRERTREAALAAARYLDPQAEITQIVPTVPALRINYLRRGGKRDHWWVMDRGVWISGGS
jgi:hypothetical protein